MLVTTTFIYITSLIEESASQIAGDGFAFLLRRRQIYVIPLKMYLVKGLIKIEIAYCKGKNVADKRETMREEQDKRDMDRAIRNARR